MKGPVQFAAILCLLGGCSGHAPKAVPAPPELATDSIDQQYRCDNGVDIAAHYVADKSGDRVQLTFKDQSYTLSSTMSASGSRYSTDRGMREHHSLTWWTKADEAMLIDEPLGNTAEAEQLIWKCHETGQN